MHREEILDFIGKQKPSTFSYFDEEKKEDVTVINHMSYFIIPFPHAVYDGILNGFNTYYKIDNFLQGMKEKNWILKNPKDEKDEKLFKCDNSMKRYIYNDMIPHIDFDKKINKKEFFQKRDNLLFQHKINPEWSLTIKQKNNDINIDFIMDDIDLWIMDDHIAFLVLKTKMPLDSELNVSEISSLFNRNMREFRSLDIDFEKQNITHHRDGGNLLDKFLVEKLSIANNSLLNITKKDLNEKEYYTIYNASFYAKMITAIHIDASKVENTEIELEPSIEPKLNTHEVNDINVMEHCAYLLCSTSSIAPHDSYANDYGYIRSQIEKSGIGIWKYWSGLTLADSLGFFGIKEEAGSAFVSQARNESYFIYMLNMYISFKIRYFEYQLIDKDFSEVEKIKFIKEKMQRLKNEYSSKEIAKKFQPNEINSAIQKGMGYLEVYDEVESNIDNTLSLSKDRTAEYIGIFGLILFFQDEIKNIFITYIMNSKIIIYFNDTFTLFHKIIIFGILSVVLIFNIKNIIKKFKRIGKKIIDIKRKYFS